MAAVSPRPELWEQQARNRRNTVVVITAFVLLLFALGLGVDWFLWGRMDAEGRAPFVPIAASIALVVGLFQALGGYFWGDRAVLAATRARLVRASSLAPGQQLIPGEPTGAREQTLINVVQEMSLASGLPMPNVYVVPDPDPNAFAVGRNPEHASIAVTEGLLERLDRAELQGVVAHELAHVRNFDIRTMTLVAALLGAVVLLSDLTQRWMWWGGGRGGRGRDRDGDRSGGGGALGIVVLVLWLVLIVVAPLLGQLMAMAVSRSREYDADASGAEFTRNPLGLASALKKIDEATDPTRSIGRGAAHLCIADPLGRAVNDREGGVATLFATHPPIQKRIAMLEAMAGAGAQPEAARAT